MGVHVESSGSGDPVLFLHGVAGSSRTYGWLRPDGRRAVRIDFRGHGASARAPGTYRLADYVADAVSVLEQLGSAVVVGHSLGGVVAWAAAQTRPELVRAAFLEDPPLFMGEPEQHERNPAIPIFAQLRELAAAWQAEGISEPEAFARLSAMPYGPDRTAADALTEHALRARAYALLHLDLEVLDRVIDGSLLEATNTTSSVSMPVFVLAADDTLGSAFPASHEARLAASHPSVAVARVRGAGHIIHDERAGRDAYVEHVSAFLANC